MKYTLLSSILLVLLPTTLAAADTSAMKIICGTKGYDKNTEGYYYGTEGTYAGCSKACKQDSSNCKSFSYGNKECNLYDVSVAGNLRTDSNSPYLFYDVSCVATPSSTSSTTVTSAASSTTSKKSTTIATTSSTTTSKPITTTTSNMSTTQKSSTTTTPVASSSTSTPPCAFPTWTVSNFRYFNSSHNLDCAGTDFNDPLCYTGRDPQPAGYGSPDSVSAVVSPGVGACQQQNPGTTPRREVGSDVVRCGGSAYQFAFFGDSNTALSTATFNVQNGVNCPDGSYYVAFGSVNFQMSCSYDSGKNATCQAVGGDVIVPATRFS